MEEETMPRPYRMRSEAEWAQLIRECKSRGLSDHQWCNQNSIPQTSFYRHLRKLHDTAIKEPTQDNGSKLSVTHTQEIVPVSVIDDPVSVPGCRDSLREPAARLTVNGITIDLFGNAGADLISSILSAASSLC